ncbi:peptidoglycan DD-metalloendopeptidase family protein [Tenggerimyces flavus]|uniref:Peptidoglycan DD-metalloendopeptidase family protein n=1 Tax=Tenggerimyces flavus TaxID=1708749 RepID=A0ABV7YI11_9ACTN|nr:peptidoglycan DD-metalloendopeptidase family protein [Tenggerimyces flavus]MBM7789917.1 murein DD-endopeptidase MepM/ murein hydrolase activator NlpD [Tenggerimyces flavus]
MAAPVPDPHVTCEFGVPGDWKAGYHTGRDYRARTGTPVFATATGRVAKLHPGTDGSYGRYVWLETDGIRHLYAHLSKILVEVGETVKAGEQLAESGNTGNTTGPHLHYEERHSPYRYLNHRKPRLDRTSTATPLVHPIWWRRLAFGTRDSDSVRALQARLNGVVRAGLPVTGNYLDLTKAAVRKFQLAQHWVGADADGLIYDPERQGGGRETTRRLFPNPPYVIHWQTL